MIECRNKRFVRNIDIEITLTSMQQWQGFTFADSLKTRYLKISSKLKDIRM